MYPPLVSIIVANFNKAQYLSRCLDSLIGQTYEHIEIILVDDCSTDESIKIATDYAKKFNNIRIINNLVNVGVAASRNIGILQAQGEYVSTLDSDDEYYPEKIEREMHVFEQYSSANVVAYSDIVIRDEGKSCLSHPIEYPTEGDAYKPILFRNGPIPRDMLIPMSLLKGMELWFDRKFPMFEDWDFKIRLLSRASLRYSGVVGIIYHQQSTGLSRGPLLRAIYWLWIVFRKNSNYSNKIEMLFGFLRLLVNMIFFKAKVIK